MRGANRVAAAATASAKGPRLAASPQWILPRSVSGSIVWLEPLLQVQISTSVPLVVRAPVTSRQSPDCTPTMVPPALTVHC